jgi:hypothetical protein
MPLPLPSPTVDELVAALKRSSLHTLVVEGREDMTIYRALEGHLSSLRVNVLPCGGRSSLLSLHERRNEFSHLHTAFLADRDMWLFTAVPAEYSDIVWTKGYSIENDVYDGNLLENLMDEQERRLHRSDLEALAKWFAFEVEEFRNGRPARVDVHINRVVPPKTHSICPQFASVRGLRTASLQQAAEILDNYQRLLKGKCLIQLLVRYLSHPSRASKYSSSNLLEIAVRLGANRPLLRQLVHAVERQLAA